jgi:hypothetical protein
MSDLRILGIGLSACVLIFLSGCEKLSSDGRDIKLPDGWSVKTDKQADFQFVTSPDGSAYVFDPSSGKISRVTPSGLNTLSEAIPILKIGGYYWPEDGPDDKPYLKYVGDGHFEPKKFTITEIPE